MLVSSLLDNDDDYTEAYQANGITVFDAPEKAAKCMLSLKKYRDIKNKKTGRKTKLTVKSKEAEKIIEDAKKNNQNALDEFQSKMILSLYGIPITKESIASLLEETIEVSNEIGYPVVLKACSHKILHKTEKGLISLNNPNSEMVKKNFNEIKKSTDRNVPILVQEMIKGKREFVAGMTKFPTFGNCILFGIGGIFTEAFNDNSIRVAPLSSPESKEMIFDIRAREIIGEYRGMPSS